MKGTQISPFGRNDRQKSRRRISIVRHSLLWKLVDSRLRVKEKRQGAWSRGQDQKRLGAGSVMHEAA
jgi:hypothetical protein